MGLYFVYIHIYLYIHRTVVMDWVECMFLFFMNDPVHTLAFHLIDHLLLMASMTCCLLSGQKKKKKKPCQSIPGVLVRRVQEV